MTDFAGAQERLAARRRAKRSEVQARLAQRDAERGATASGRSTVSLNRIERAGHDFWSAIKGREGTRPVFRVGQVDAELLDEELLELLRGQVGEALKYFGSHLRDDWRAEILLGLRAALFKLSVWDHNATYGAALQNLRFTNARHDGPVYAPPTKPQKALHGLFTVFGKYAWTKWEDYLVDQEGGYDEPSPTIRRLSRLTSSFTTIHSFAAFASFLIFLVNGRYRTVLDRILRLRLAPPTNQVSREVSFEYLNRQLVWHAFTEFLLFVLPLVGISRWRRWLARAWRRIKSATRLQTGNGEDGSLDDAETEGELGFLPERTCAICYQDQNPNSASENEIPAVSGASSGVIGSAQTDVTNPYEAMPCGCVYCFVCLAQRLEGEEGEGWVCLRCGEVVRECKPWSGDVAVEPEEKSRRGGKAAGKTVGFEDEQPASGAEKDALVSGALDPSSESGSEAAEEEKDEGEGGEATESTPFVDKQGGDPHDWSKINSVNSAPHEPENDEAGIT